MLSEAMQEHLTKKILPFWENLKDEKNGGYYGYMDFAGNIDKKAVKGGILHLRILWFFSSAYDLLKDEETRQNMEHAYAFVNKYILDPVRGGAFWSVTAEGVLEDSTKHTYCQGFAIYALSAYYHATGNKEALNKALSLYETVEEHCTDDRGYLEAFDADFKPVSNEKLSENGVMAEKTMNTLLHILEGYTELYRETQDQRVRKSLEWILSIIADKVYNPKLRRQEVFFDADMNSILDLHSYGHDIETSWLVDRALEVLPKSSLHDKIEPITKALAERIYERAYVDHSLLNENEKGVDDTWRIWWVQAESVVGFVNAYMKDTSETRYLEAAKDIWNYIETKMVDPKDGLEWYWRVDENGQPDQEKPFVEPWKCPYHNGRMCMEIIKRRKNFASEI